MKDHGVAEEIDHLADLHQQADAAQVAIAKWLINALWLMHAGVIVGVLAKIDAWNLPPSNVPRLWPFVAGILCAFSAGAATWANYSVRTASYLSIRQNLISGEILKPESFYRARLRITGAVGLCAAMVSLGFLVIGALTLINGWVRVP
ncbi:MAG TPA: hypothetical protein VNQ99_17700 [Xanthobacteraceae bacterium]|nr:hypothetical protein [Xanthobacteraceae bacterium]